MEIVSIGRELLRGRIPDANAPWLAEFFSQRGALVHRITTVDDTDRAITGSVTEALSRGSHLVVTTGGLGPATDDRTAGAVADALRLPLALHPGARDLVEAAYRRLEQRKMVVRGGMNAAREKMATLPVGAEAVPNPGGTAPGILVRVPGGGGVLCLPGVPEEMKTTFEEALPLLRELAPRGAVARREVEAPTADESALLPLLDRLTAEFPSIWVKSHAPGLEHRDARILVTLEASAPTKNEAESVVEGALRRLIGLASGA